MKINDLNIFYVYAYLRELDNTPYYIGKGKDSPSYGIKRSEETKKLIGKNSGLARLGKKRGPYKKKVEKL